MVAHIDALGLPAATGLCVWALDHEFVEHGLNNLRNRAYVVVGLNNTAARGTGPAAVWLGRPGMVKAFAAKVVFAGELNRLVKGRVADEADEVAVGLAEVFEILELWRDFDHAAVSTLGRGRV